MAKKNEHPPIPSPKATRDKNKQTITVTYFLYDPHIPIKVIAPYKDWKKWETIFEKK